MPNAAHLQVMELHQGVAAGREGATQPEAAQVKHCDVLAAGVTCDTRPGSRRGAGAWPRPVGQQLLRVGQHAPTNPSLLQVLSSTQI